jgi:hypothetical protein
LPVKPVIWLVVEFIEQVVGVHMVVVLVVSVEVEEAGVLHRLQQQVQ